MMTTVHSLSRIGIAAIGVAAAGAALGAGPARAAASGPAPTSLLPGSLANLLPRNLEVARTDQHALPIAGAPEAAVPELGDVSVLGGLASGGSLLGTLL